MGKALLQKNPTNYNYFSRVTFFNQDVKTNITEAKQY